jgi:23S rRNA (guanosine2251-2'-O)-methyltransferase
MSQRRNDQSSRGGKRRGKGPTKRKGGSGQSSGKPQGVWIYGVHPVEEYLDLGGKVEHVWVARDRVPEGIMERLERRGVHAERVDMEQLDELLEAEPRAGSHQGVVVQGGTYAYGVFEDLLEELEGRQEAFVVALDQVQDVGNLGAILRSAAAFGVDAVVIPRDRAAGVTGAAIRASAGQALRVRIIQVTNMTRALDELKQRGCWVLGTVLGQERPVTPWGVDVVGMKAVVVLGGEHGGVRRLVGEQCDYAVEIPMAGEVESLNVASAASVLMYEVMRQRKSVEERKKVMSEE